MSATKEATIVISGILMSDAQSMAIRVAVANFLMELSDEKFCEQLGPIADGYRARLSEVQEAIFRSAR